MTKAYLTVSALNRYVQHKLDKDPHLDPVFVEGEISDLYLHRMSQHMYMTIKDSNAQIRAVMFRSDNEKLGFKPENGMKVQLTGKVTMYPKSGQYQLNIYKMEPSGIGALHLAYEQLKEKLEKQGLFSKAFKKTIPAFPRQIAVITARDGAAVRDIITTIQKRYPIVQLTILPVSVQGERAVASIVQAIEQANRHPFDTIILARGGGSIEDLASFNDERIAMAIFHSKIPIITGVGHETDTTISDFVADLRAPTPTGAAQFAVPSLEELERSIAFYQKKIIHHVRSALSKKEEHVKYLAQARAFRNPLQFVKEKEQEIDQASDKIQYRILEQLHKKQAQQRELLQRLEANHPKEKLAALLREFAVLKGKLEHVATRNLHDKQHELQLLVEKLSLLNPLEIMKRGYSITYKNDKVVKSSRQLMEEDVIRLSFSDGAAICQVKEVRQDEKG